MKVIIKMLLIAGLAYLTMMYAPWWGVVVVAFLVSAILPTNDFGAFLGGFLGVGLLWLVLSWKIDVETDSIISEKIASLFPLGGDVTMLLIISGIIGGLSGGFGSISGNLFRKIWMKKKKKSLYR